jgi:polar amino acid transport system substrate-binding protein
VFEVFAPTRYKVGFKSKSIKNDFNEGLAALRKSGRYDEIILKYIE